MGQPPKIKMLRRLFKVSIALKGLDGILEIGGGLALLWISPSQINYWFALLSQHELAEDPHDFFVTHISALLHTLTPSLAHFGAIYLLFHGAIKVFLVLNLFRRKLWAYPAAIFFLISFVFYQLYRYSHTHSIVLLMLSLIDSAIIVLVWKEYKYLKNENTGT